MYLLKFNLQNFAAIVDPFRWLGIKNFGKNVSYFATLMTPITLRLFAQVSLIFLTNHKREIDFLNETGQRTVYSIGIVPQKS